MSTKVVLASGVFDGPHPGHEYFLAEARKLGDRLVVVVTSHGHATRTKRSPKFPAAARVAAVRGLNPVDEAFVGPDPYDLKAVLDRVRPGVIALGHDQTFDEEQLKAEAKAIGHTVQVVRVGHLSR